MPSRREFLAGGLALVATACSGGGSGGPGPTGPLTIARLTRGAPQLSLLGLGPGAIGGDPTEPVQTGKSIVTFDLATPASRIVEGGTPKLYIATNENGRASGPFPGDWSPFTGYQKTGDRSPRSPIPGVYFGPVVFPRARVYTVAAADPGGPSKGVGITHVYVADKPPNAAGSKATPAKTPVATSPHGVREICTRVPPCPLHFISLAEALANGKPTVAVFSTPLLCQSRLCGPVTDEVILVFQQMGKGKANFVHVEEFLPGPDLKPDASKLSPGFRAWGLRTEPWVFVIDREGTIRDRYQGPTTAPMIEA